MEFFVYDALYSYIQVRKMREEHKDMLSKLDRGELFNLIKPDSPRRGSESDEVDHMMELPRAVFMWIDVRLVFPKVEASSKSENEAAVRSLVGPVTVRDKARIGEMLTFTKEFNATIQESGWIRVK